MQMLYAIAKEKTTVGVPAEKSVAEAVLEICDQTNAQLKKISNSLGPMPENLLKKDFAPTLMMA